MLSERGWLIGPIKTPVTVLFMIHVCLFKFRYFFTIYIVKLT